MKIQLTECPQTLQDAVNEKIRKQRNYRIFSVTYIESHIYSTEGVLKSYSVYLEWGNLFTVMECSYWPEASPLDGKVFESSVSAHDVIEITKNSEFFKLYNQ